MSTAHPTENNARGRRRRHAAGLALLAGGAAYFAGGSIHPSDDPPGLSVKEHLLLLFEDPSWYSSHALLLVAMVLIAVALVVIVHSGALAAVTRAHKVATFAAAVAVLASLDMVLHLVVATEADRIEAGLSTPLTDVHVIAETITTPLFGLGIAALAVVGARTRTLGNTLTAVLGILGGLAYALAGATFLLTDALNFLFPFSSGIALWAIGVGAGLLRRWPAAVAPPSAARMTGEPV